MQILCYIIGEETQRQQVVLAVTPCKPGGTRPWRALKKYCGVVSGHIPKFGPGLFIHDYHGFFYKTMEKTPLNKVRSRINIDDYTPKEYSDYLRSIGDLIFSIRFKDGEAEEEITVKISPSQLAHLTGFQYAYNKISKKQFFRGEKALDTMQNMTFSNIRNNINNNHIAMNKSSSRYINWESDIRPRFEYLPFALNTLTKNYFLREQEEPAARLVNTKIKGNYFYYKTSQNYYLIFSLLKMETSYTIETFIVNSGLLFLACSNFLDIIDVTIKHQGVSI